MGATCTNIGGGFKCNCKAGFRGDGEVCKDVDECSENSFKCHAHSSCKNRPGDYGCACDDGYYAFDTGCRKDDACRSQPCQNGGECQVQGNAFKCTCASGWSGDTCGTRVSTTTTTATTTTTTTPTTTTTTATATTTTTTTAVTTTTT